MLAYSGATFAFKYWWGSGQKLGKGEKKKIEKRRKRKKEEKKDRGKEEKATPRAPTQLASLCLLITYLGSLY